jgi:hypothetical protein
LGRSDAVCIGCLHGTGADRRHVVVLSDDGNASASAASAASPPAAFDRYPDASASACDDDTSFRAAGHHGLHPDHDAATDQAGND